MKITSLLERFHTTEMTSMVTQELLVTALFHRSNNFLLVFNCH